jgi:hypothetical protein
VMIVRKSRESRTDEQNMEPVAESREDLAHRSSRRAY